MPARIPIPAQDSLWLAMDSPSNLMVIDGITVLAGPVDRTALRAVLQERLLDRFPVFRRHPVHSRLRGWEWREDPDFRLNRHVTHVLLRSGADGPPDMRALMRHVSRQRSRSFDPEHPMWRVTLIEGLVLADGSPGAAVHSRFHHSIADGVRLTQVMLSLCDGDDSEIAAIPARSPDGRLITLDPRRWRDAVGSLTGLAERVANDLTTTEGLLLGGPGDRGPWTGEPGVRKAVAWSPPFPLAHVKDIGAASGASVNEVLMAAVAGGLRAYATEHGHSPRESAWMVPVNLVPFADNLPATLGNHFALVRFELPLHIDDVRARLREIHARAERVRASDEAVLTFGLQQVISKSPHQIGSLLTTFFADKEVGVLSNVPGPRGPITFGGSPVVQHIGFAPCSGSQTITATLFSAGGGVTIGFATDAGLMPDPERLTELVVAEFDQLHGTLAVSPG